MNSKCINDCCVDSKLQQKSNVLKYAKTRKVKDPVRSDDLASGIDFFIPYFTDDFLRSLKEKNPSINDIKKDVFEYIIVGNSIYLAPGSSLLIPSGIKMLGTPNVTLNACNKSGVASKKQLVRLAEVVDANYQGEIHISISNISNYIVRVCEGEKIIQFLQMPVIYDMPKEYDIETLFEEVSVRGEGGFGSSGNK